MKTTLALLLVGLVATSAFQVDLFTKYRIPQRNIMDIMT